MDRFQVEARLEPYIANFKLCTVPILHLLDVIMAQYSQMFYGVEDTLGNFYLAARYLSFFDPQVLCFWYLIQVICFLCAHLVSLYIGSKIVANNL